MSTPTLAGTGTSTGTAGFPFSAILGMADLQLGLLLNAVSPAIGGLLVRGEKGTAKSTAVRALAALLPPIEVVPGCRFACEPGQADPSCPDGPHDAAVGELRPARLVELPVGAAEDRVVGSLDLEQALAHGVRAFEPGLLAAAHRGLLYVDEVNLLHDHLVDLLLDAAAMGRSHVERESVSVSHAARFLLVGTMNPEEGELRPQLLDRFGLTVEVRASREAATRAEVVRRRLAADADPEGFAAAWRDADQALAVRVAQARALLPRVVLADAALRQIAEVCAAFDVDGMRADIVTARTAIAHAAWQGRTVVDAQDVRVAARLALPHRRRRDPFDAPGLDEDLLDEALERAGQDHPNEHPDDEHPDDEHPDDEHPDDEHPDDDPPPGGGGGGPAGPGGSDVPPGSGDAEGPRHLGGAGGQPDSGGCDVGGSDASGDVGTPDASGEAPERGSAGAGRIAAPVTGLKARLLTAPGIGEGVPGRRSRARTGRGRTTAARIPVNAAPGAGSVHLPATVRAAAVHQRRRGRRAGEPLRLRAVDVREAVREGREGNLVVFAVDASGSMGARSRMEAVKGAVLSLLTDAYQRRDKVAVIAFRGTVAEVLLPATSSVEAAQARLARLATGGRTPLAEGLLAVRDLVRVEALRDPRRRPLVLLLTDGRATSGPRPRERCAHAAALLAATGVAHVVVDCESGPVRLGLARQLAADLGAEYHPLAGVAVDPLARLAVRSPRSAA